MHWRKIHKDRPGRHWVRYFRILPLFRTTNFYKSSSLCGLSCLPVMPSPLHGLKLDHVSTNSVELPIRISWWYDIHFRRACTKCQGKFGGTDATVNLTLHIFLLVGRHLYCCLFCISFVHRNQRGNHCRPTVAVGLVRKGRNSTFMVAIVVGGLFGDNLGSFISDTTIALW